MLDRIKQRRIDLNIVGDRQNFIVKLF
jgi:hypothetical protein